MPTPRIPFPTTPSEYIVAPTGGWSPDIPTWELAADQAPLLENFQIKPGKLRVRPPYKVTADLTTAAVSLAGWVPFVHGTSVLGKRLFTSGFNVEPQNLHRVGVSVPASTTVVASGPTLIQGSTVTNTGVMIATGFRYATFGIDNYALSYAAPSNATLVYTDGITGWAHSIVAVSPLGAIGSFTGSPTGCIDIYENLNRLWILGGLASGGTPPASTTRLFFTNPIQGLSASITNWQDPVSGLYNQIEIDQDTSDPGVALASVPAGIIILRQKSLFILRGTDPTTYVLRPVSRQAGCIDARSVVEIDSKVYFMSDKGFMVTDGTQVQNVSGALQDELYRQIAAWTNAVFTSTGAWCTADEMSDGKILVSFGAYSVGNVSVNYTMIGAFSGVFDPATGVWTKVSTAINPTASASVGPSIQAYGQLLTLGNTQQVAIEDIVTGQSVVAPSSLHDVSTVGGAFVPITATWTTKSPQANLASRGKIQIKRTFMDYAVSTGGATGTVTYQLADRINNFTLATNSIPASTNSSDPRQYLQRDEFHEVSDLAITVTMAGTSTTGATSVPKAEIVGVGVEFSATSDMRPKV